jgi:uncharacterized protein involved in exopolysaccharide biosynthesis
MDESKRAGLLDLLIVLLERKWLLCAGVVVFCAAGIAVSGMMAKSFTATAVIMKPASAMPGLGALLGKELPVSGLLKSLDITGGSDADNFMSVLKSRRLEEKVIDRFNLVRYYGFAKRKKYYIEDVLKQAGKSAKVTQNDFGNIEMAVTDTSPAMAAAMANFMLLELDTITYQLARESAMNSRIFFEERLALVKQDLDTAAGRLALFKTENKYIDLEQQTKSSVEALAQFEAQNMALDLEIGQLRSQFGAGNQRIAELQKEKSVIQKNIKGFMASGGGNLIIALKDAPEKAVRYGYLLRDVKVQESLYEFVLQLCEQARFSESNNVPAVQVLEYAQVPQRKSRPHRSTVCLVFLCMGFALTSLYIVGEKWFAGQKRLNTPLYSKTMHAIYLLLSIKRHEG